MLGSRFMVIITVKLKILQLWTRQRVLVLCLVQEMERFVRYEVVLHSSDSYSIIRSKCACNGKIPPSILGWRILCTINLVDILILDLMC